MLTQLINPDNYTFTIHAASSMLVGSATAVLGVYVLIREYGSRIGVIFWLFSVCISTWLMGFGMAYASIAPGPALCWIRLNQMGVAFIPAAVLALIAAMVLRERQYRTLIGSSIVLSSLFCLGVAATNLHVKGLYRYFWGYFPEYGPLGVIFLAYFFGIMIYILYLSWMEYRKTTNIRHKKRMKGMAAAFSIAYLASFDFLAAFGVPLYPFGYVPMLIFLAITAFVIRRYRLVDITPELAASQILETMQGAVIVVDFEDKVRIINQAAQAMLGYRGPEAIGKDLSSVVGLPRALTEDGFVRRNNVRGHETTLLHKDGRRVDVSLSVSTVTDRDGSLAGTAYVAHDITERKSSEEKMKKYAEELKQSNEDVLSFAYIVSHDLRAPLVSIKGFACELQLALEDIDALLDKCAPHLSEQERARITAALRNDAPEAMRFINSSVSRMDGLINAVLVLSRMGRRELKPERVDMRELTQAVLGSLEHQIARRKTSVFVDALPAVLADKISMEQIMGNLLDNTLKYLDPGRDGEIAVTFDRTAEEVIFRVRDNGRGIAKEDMHKVFEIFRRAGKQDVPGEGMGLAYVKTLVRRHGGRIWCDSELGKGSTFSFSFPDKLLAHP